MDKTLLMDGLKQRDRKVFDMLFDLLYKQLPFFTEQITKDVPEAQDTSNSFSYSYPLIKIFIVEFTSRLRPDQCLLTRMPWYRHSTGYADMINGQG